MASNPLNSHSHQIYEKASEPPFRYIGLLGTGAFGAVDEVEGTGGTFFGQVYARKQIQLSRGKTREKEISAIQREVDIMKELNHQHVVRVATTYILGNFFSIIMEPRADENLEFYLEQADSPSGQPGKEARKMIAKWFRCLLNGIEYVHEEGIKHRDIKPTNILAKDENILFADFGISKMGIGRTVPTTMVGRPRARTLEYCAPEVEEGHTRGRSADIFSLGAVFLEMLTVIKAPGQLETLREALKHNNRLSYAKKLGNAVEWMDKLKGTCPEGSWYHDVLFLCQEMMKAERHQRPHAGDICSWLSSKPSSEISTNCSCNEISKSFTDYSIVDLNQGLMKAMERGHRLMAGVMMDRGAEIQNNDEALVASAKGGLLDMVESLLQKGAKVNAKGALLYASAGGFREVLQLLLDNGADVKAKDKRGQTALHLAADRGYKPVVEIILKHKADIEAKDRSGSTALHLAAEKGHQGVIRVLLNNGADANALNSKGKTATQMASSESIGELISSWPWATSPVATNEDDDWF